MKSQAIFLATAGSIFLGGAGASAAEDAVPAQLRPPGNEKVLFEAHAEGVQVYVSTAQAGDVGHL